MTAVKPTKKKKNLHKLLHVWKNSVDRNVLGVLQSEVKY